jgi:hypothetical protein
MQNSYVLGKDKKKWTLAEFPQIDAGEQVAIYFTGGYKSYLIGLIATQLYGIQNIVFVSLVLDYNIPMAESINIKNNFTLGVRLLNGINTYVMPDSITYNGATFDSNNMIQETEMYGNAFIHNLKKAYPNVRYILSGYNLLHTETIKFLQNNNWDKGLITNHQLPALLEQQKDIYPVLYRRFYRNSTEPRLGRILRKRWGNFNSTLNYFSNMLSPFRNLDDYEILEIYDQNNLLPQLALTSVCRRLKNDLNCGKCNECVDRKTAFAMAVIPDLAKYSLN